MNWQDVMKRKDEFTDGELRFVEGEDLFICLIKKLKTVGNVFEVHIEWAAWQKNGTKWERYTRSNGPIFVNMEMTEPKENADGSIHYDMPAQFGFGHCTIFPKGMNSLNSENVLGL